MPRPPANLTTPGLPAASKAIAFEVKFHGATAEAIDTQVRIREDGIPVADLGLSVEEALAIRGRVGHLLRYWDDPELDIYNELLLEG